MPYGVYARATILERSVMDNELVLAIEHEGVSGRSVIRIPNNNNSIALHLCKGAKIAYTLDELRIKDLFILAYTSE